MRRVQRLVALFIICIPIIALDRYTKQWAQSWLAAQPGGAAPAWPGVFGWVYARNTGMAFSAFSGATALLGVVSFVLVAAIVGYVLGARRISKCMLVALSMIAAGGIGNLWDRVFLGYVVDFIHLEFMRFAVFNVADIFVCIGEALFILALLLSGRKPKEERL